MHFPPPLFIEETLIYALNRSYGRTQNLEAFSQLFYYWGKPIKIFLQSKLTIYSLTKVLITLKKKKVKKYQAVA